MISSTKAYQAAVTADARRMYVKAIVDISDPDMDITGAETSSTAPWSDIESLYDKETDPPARYATLERNRWMLDGTFSIFPDNFAVADAGYALNDLSGNDGMFTTPQTVALSFSNTDILQAFSLFFSSNIEDGVPDTFTVEVIQGSTAYFTKTVTGNRESTVSFDGFTVYNPQQIKVTITKWSLPGRRVRLVEIIPGVYEEWYGAAIAAFSLTQQSDFSCITIPYGTLKLSINNTDRRFEPRNKESLFQSIEARQGIQVFIGVLLPNGSVEYKPVGIYYHSEDGWKTSTNSPTIDWSMIDIVGLLAQRAFIVPASLPTTLSGWLAAVVAQLGDNFADRYHVDPEYANLSVTASGADAVSGVSCGDIIRWACMATGTWPRADAETGHLTAEPLWEQGNAVKLHDLTAYPTMSANESIAALIFELDSGQYVVSGNSTSSEKTITISNPFIHDSAQALAAARLILSCYGGNVLDLNGRGDPSSEIGDVDTVWLDESNATSARRKVQTFQIQDGVLQGCTSKLLQADGSYLYEGFAVIRANGTWKAPAGVTQLRVVIGSGGQGGGVGQEGQWEFAGNSNISFSGYNGVPGQNGVDGQGGRIWYGVIPINPEQEFEVALGSGGAPGNVFGQAGARGQDTTFGSYSSENGNYYEVGYTDIANGQVFARTGVAAPLAGTGDGGKGGAGGTAPAGHTETYEYTPDGADPSVVNTATEWFEDVPPGPGQPGTPGASGFVMVTWDKGEEA